MDNGAVAVIGAVGTLLAGVIGALGGWYLKILSERNKMLLAEKELDLKAKKEEATAQRSRETIKELNEAIDQLGSDRDEDRKQIHALRDRLNAQGLELAVCQVKLTACEEDRVELRTHLQSMATEMRKHNIFVQPIPSTSSPLPPPTPQGGLS